ncbi:MAG: hypothetical protein LCH56_17870 [Proteobacteria bacterium]|nr:hypothetical protein [Pseudomonadota bacterium]
MGIDDFDRLYVRPAHGNSALPFIYRAGMGVAWDETRQVLFPRPPSQDNWTQYEWFRQIIAAAIDECGIRLRMGTETKWSGVSDELRMQIEAN